MAQDEQDIDMEAWARAKGAAKTGRIVELGRDFFTGMPHYPTHPDFEVSLFRRHGDRVRGDGASSASCQWHFGGHTGTHIDALCHVSQEGLMFDGSAADNDRIERGDSPGDAASLPAFVRRGVLFDMAGFLGVDVLPEDRALSATDFAAAADARGITLGEGDTVLVRTGWGRHWGTDAYGGHETPGPDHSGGLWLADRGARLVGSDTAVFEKGPVTEAAPVHRLMLIERRIPIMENLDLEVLAATGVTEFLFLALPLRARGATASPLRPVAVV